MFGCWKWDLPVCCRHSGSPGWWSRWVWPCLRRSCWREKDRIRSTEWKAAVCSSSTKEKHKPLPTSHSSHTWKHQLHASHQLTPHSPTEPLNTIFNTLQWKGSLIVQTHITLLYTYTVLSNAIKPPEGSTSGLFWSQVAWQKLVLKKHVKNSCVLHNIIIQFFSRIKHLFYLAHSCLSINFF